MPTILKAILSLGTRTDKFYDDLPGIDTADFESYLNALLHQWLRLLAALGFTLVPIFFILDVVTAPNEMIVRFGIYRLISVVLVVCQYFIIRYTKPNRWSFIHGYLISFNVGGIITVMTVHLGGFNSGYYAGLNLVMVAVNMLLPWKPVNSVVNSSIIIGSYTILNLIFGKNIEIINVINHLFFMFGTGIISVSINYVKNKLEEKEFYLRAELKKTRDALWGEMEIAKRIQTALLPRKVENVCTTDTGLGCYTIAANMIPADEVGGDYYDVIESPHGERWIAIGDVTGHGVESGLIMMMTQTSIFSIVNNTTGLNPSSVLTAINRIIKENIARLGSDRYVAISLIRLHDSKMVVSGKHQDILVYRAALKRVEVIQTEGTWIGIYDKIKKHMTNITIPVELGDTILLFTDGVTEATDKNGLMFGQERLANLLESNAALPVQEIQKIIIEDVVTFSERQYDDITLLTIRRDS